MFKQLEYSYLTLRYNGLFASIMPLIKLKQFLQQYYVNFIQIVLFNMNDDLLPKI